MIMFQKTDFCLPSTTLSIAFSAFFFFEGGVLLHAAVEP